MRLSRDAPITLPNLAQLIEWTAQYAEGGNRDELEVAQAMWDFIVEADKLMVDEWKDMKGYSLDEARHDLARWLR